MKCPPRLAIVLCLSRFDGQLCGRWQWQKGLTNLVREVANANAVERRCRVGHCGCWAKEVGSNGDVDEQNFKPHSENRVCLYLLGGKSRVRFLSPLALINHTTLDCAGEKSNNSTPVQSFSIICNRRLKRPISVIGSSLNDFSPGARFRIFTPLTIPEFYLFYCHARNGFTPRAPSEVSTCFALQVRCQMPYDATGYPLRNI